MPEEIWLRRIPVCMCLDISGSMSEYINEVNQIAGEFSRSLKAKSRNAAMIEIGCVTFGGGSTGALRTKSDPEYTDDGKPKIFQNKPLTIREITPLGEAVITALDKIEERKDMYKRIGIACATPTLILVSDGNNTEDKALLKTAQDRVRNLVAEKKLIFIPVGVGDVHRANLQNFSPDVKVLSVKDFGRS